MFTGSPQSLQYSAGMTSPSELCSLLAYGHCQYLYTASVCGAKLIAAGTL